MSLKERKLTCSTPNANRKRGGVAYYCVPSSNKNFLCWKVDEQVEDWIKRIQIDPEHMPAIREACKADIRAFAQFNVSNERQALQTELEKFKKYERQLYMDKVNSVITQDLYEQLWLEFKDQRDQVLASLDALEREEGLQLQNLDQALTLIAQIGVLYKRLDKFQQRALLKHLIKRVVINTEGLIVRMDLHPPFAYLIAKAHDAGDTSEKSTKRTTGDSKKVTTRSSLAPLCAPRGTRTPDTRFRKPLLWPLSYEGMSFSRFSLAKKHIHWQDLPTP